jgi:hypothetical protein
MLIRTGEAMFTYEWLGMPSECGVSRVLDRSMSSHINPNSAIAHAKTVLKSQIVFPAGKPYAVRVLNYDSILVWTGTIHDT